ncbi:PEP-CTERM sorting domain-containing protein [Halomicronema sp. CCY15110]|uniref:PEP-CTERM sorting domain-containing protein n=1 Tax=Halomicronema sp. CCY15110 TaxID=2767773 RepID=UPI00194FB946|nr:PEP-CTERM sorting domain-containing protein [Halomicronema sp. CCY15110]
MKSIFAAAIAATLGCLSALPAHAAALSSLNNGVVKFAPSTSEADLLDLNAASISFGDTTIYIGTFQKGRNNQDPIVTSFTNGVRDWIQYYDTSGIDGRGAGLLWDETSQNLYGVFTADGGSQGTETFGQATQGGWLSGYGAGGGAAVSVLLKLNPNTGDSEAGTFIRSALSSGNTNTVRPTGLDFVDNQVVFFGDSFFAPVDINGQRFDDLAPGFNTPFEYRVVLTTDLSQATRAESIGWNGVTEFSPLTTATGSENSGSDDSENPTDSGTTGAEGGGAGTPEDSGGATAGDATGQDDTPATGGTGDSGSEIVDDIEPGKEAESVPEPGVLVGLLAIMAVGVWRQRSHTSASKAA